MIAIIDYGLGNVQALANVYHSLHLPCKAAKRAADLKGATKLILPGVGAFDQAMVRLQASGLREPVEELVLRQGMAVLGICVGMQMLMDSSQEGKLPGLSWIKGEVRRFDPLKHAKPLQVPHMGWNHVRPVVPHGLFKQLEENARFYFLHSYYVCPVARENALAVAQHGDEFACAVHRGAIYGVQFHPEKSHHYGVELLKNFAEL